MFSRISVERIVRAIRFATLSAAAIYGTHVALIEHGSVQAGCNNSDCRTTYYTEGPRSYCTLPGTVYGENCVLRERPDGSKYCWLSSCYTDDYGL